MSKSELPSVTIATESDADRFELADSMEAAAAKLWPMLVRIPYLGEPNRNGSHSHGSVFWRRMTEEHLAAMLAALPAEQRERVLGPSRHVRHCSHSDYCPNCGYQVVRHK